MALINLGPMPSLYLVGTSVQPAFYNLTAATKTLLSCLTCVRLFRNRNVGESRRQLDQIVSDIGTAVESVMRVSRENLENGDFFRRWCREKGEDWSSVASDYNLLVQALGITSRMEKYIKVSWYDDFNKLHADVQKKK